MYTMYTMLRRRGIPITTSPVYPTYLFFALYNVQSTLFCRTKFVIPTILYIISIIIIICIIHYNMRIHRPFRWRFTLGSWIRVLHIEHNILYCGEGGRSYDRNSPIFRFLFMIFTHHIYIYHLGTTRNILRILKKILPLSLSKPVVVPIYNIR